VKRGEGKVRGGKRYSCERVCRKGGEARKAKGRKKAPFTSSQRGSSLKGGKRGAVKRKGFKSAMRREEEIRKERHIQRERKGESTDVIE